MIIYLYTSSCPGVKRPKARPEAGRLRYNEWHCPARPAATPQAAANAMLAGMRWCYEQGVYPKWAAWIVSGGAVFSTREPAPLEYYAHLIQGRQQLYAEYDLPVPATDCRHCLTQSCEGDLAVLDPARYAVGAAALPEWDRHPVAHVHH